MNRRNFLLNTGIVGAGLLGAGNAAPGLLRAGTATNSDSNLTLEETPVAFTVPPLPYSFDALEPYIDAKTMEIHHNRHHLAYITAANNLLKSEPKLLAMPVEELLADVSKVPEKIRQGVINNAGGHSNHSIFWVIMGPGKGGQPVGSLAPLC